MTDTIDVALLSAAEHLAALNRESRERGWKQMRQLVVAQLPDDEVGRPPVKSLGEYLDNPIELPPMLVEPGLVARGAISAMVARGGKGKTSVSLNRLIRWSMGKPLFTELPEVMAPVEPLRSLIIENEGAPGHFQQVVRTILTENDFTDDDIALARENVHVWGDGGWSGLKLDNEANVQLVDRAVGETRADVVFVEPFRGLWKGDENSSTDMANILDSFSAIANNHACGFLVTHHERKSGVGEDGDPMSAARGSGALEGAAAVMERWRHVAGGKASELSWTKARFKDAPAPVRMTFRREGWSYEYVPESTSERGALTILARHPDERFSAQDIADELDESYTNVRRWLNNLADDDRAVRTRHEGRYHYRAKTSDRDNDDVEGLAIS